jgi:hypothetical protein
VVAALRRDLLAPDLVRDVVARAIAMQEETRRDTRTHRGDLEAELSRLGVELARYAEAVATTGPVPALLRAIETREQRRVQVQARLTALDASPGHRKPHSAATLRAAMIKRLDDWHGLMTRHPVQARETVIRPLLLGRVMLTPNLAERTYQFAAPMAYDGLLEGFLAVYSLTTSGGW